MGCCCLVPKYADLKEEAAVQYPDFFSADARRELLFNPNFFSVDMEEGAAV